MPRSGGVPQTKGLPVVRSFSGRIPTPGGPAIYVYTGAGGLTFAGVGVVGRDRAYVPSGGLVFASGGTVLRIRAYVPSGILTFGGAATIARIRAYVPSGGAVLGGTAAVLRVRAYVPSGSVTFGGTALLARTRIWTPAGGIVFAGAAVTTAPPAPYAGLVSNEPIGTTARLATLRLGASRMGAILPVSQLAEVAKYAWVRSDGSGTLNDGRPPDAATDGWTTVWS